MSPRARLRGLVLSGMAATGLLSLAAPAGAAPTKPGPLDGILPPIGDIGGIISDRRVKRDLTPVHWTR
ncbi:hypothetical protein [Thermomonospora umbrina]|uniref:Uncharacterized protein n=1 Tax=Thermomonospora umbrina TaxID=111806 RepID=A0A3D9T6J6_9ACTN|nr:hypothetical protein [Thermomonospora umbrina]REF00846.1 hypothetical protein DFJ69_6440 [Thermomonospora umbrina]